MHECKGKKLTQKKKKMGFRYVDPVRFIVVSSFSKSLMLLQGVFHLNNLHLWLIQIFHEHNFEKIAFLKGVRWTHI